MNSAAAVIRRPLERIVRSFYTQKFKIPDPIPMIPFSYTTTVDITGVSKMGCIAAMSLITPVSFLGAYHIRLSGLLYVSCLFQLLAGYTFHHVV